MILPSPICIEISFGVSVLGWQCYSSEIVTCWIRILFSVTLFPTFDESIFTIYSMTACRLFYLHIQKASLELRTNLGVHCCKLITHIVKPPSSTWIRNICWRIGTRPSTLWFRTYHYSRTTRHNILRSFFLEDIVSWTKNNTMTIRCFSILKPYMTSTKMT